jgi:glycosyltransferase involved in cell wall biosynthesis
VKPRALVVTNMYPSPARPAFGRFVRDQVEALRALGDFDIDVFAFEGGTPAAYVAAGRELRRRYGGGGRRGLGGLRFDVVHAHFGLTAWPAMAVPARVRAVTLHGTDLAHARSRPITLAALRRIDLVGAVSAELAATVPRWALRRGAALEVLPSGVDLGRFQPIDRDGARGALGLHAEGPYLLLPADPARPEKRADLARRVAGAAGAELLTLGAVEPERVPLYVNAANAVLVPSDREGFGLAVLEALACDVPVLATPHGVAPEALAGVDGTLCAPFDDVVWGAAVAPHVAAADPRVAGRSRASRYSAEAMARRLADAWERLLGS